MTSYPISKPSILEQSLSQQALGKPVVPPEELQKINAYWRACNYLAVGMIYLQDNPLLQKTLTIDHIKPRLLGHWGTSPGLSFIYIHLNRLIKKYDLNMMFVAGPGHGAPGVLGPIYLEGTYSEVYPDKSQDAVGMQKFFKQFSFPGHIGSHCTPEMPGSIHEGGELGYSLSHAYGSVMDSPDLITAVVVGDGEAETGPLATAWHSNKFLNPIRDGVVLPILHLNGYKIANPSILARVSHDELESLFIGYGYHPYFVEGHDPETMHELMATALEQCILEIRTFQAEARNENATPTRPRYPMIILRSPKGWTGPEQVDGHQVEGSWRSHQVPIANMSAPGHLQLLEDWLRSYKPEELFDANGTLISDLQGLAPKGVRRMSANPSSNGGTLRKELRLHDYRDYAVVVTQPGETRAENTKVLGLFLRDVMANNMTNFRLFGPDETASNRLQDMYSITKKTWMGEYLPEDADGGELSPDGRVMEMLSEHTLQGWLEGYLLTGHHGLLNTYEAFAHVIDSMLNQYAKWLDSSKHSVTWRSPLSSLNILLSSVVWRQDHNGFSHQDPGFIDLVTNKSPSVTRIYLPPDANCLLSVADHCLRSTDYINVIVSDKQLHRQYLTIDQAVTHCTKGIGIWDWASTDGAAADEPDVILACCGDVPTMEALAAASILCHELPDLKVRFINVVDLYKLMHPKDHIHGLSEIDFETLFTADKPIIFNFHGYPWLIHKLTYARQNQDRIHVRGYKEKGNINTPMELAIRNQIDRFNLVIDVINRVPKLRASAAHVKEKMKDAIIVNLNYAFEHGKDQDDIVNWKWSSNLENKT